MNSIKQELALKLSAFLKSKGSALSADEIHASFEPPREEKFGDLSTSILLRAAKELKTAPRALGEEAARYLSAGLGGRLARVTVDGPGFINAAFSSQEIASVLLEIHRSGMSFGKPGLPSKKILLEYVSANPTGPLTVAHGRQAALGDALARILRFCGHQVTTEYYNNDEGVQINTLGQSTLMRLKQVSTGREAVLPENFYQGEYLIPIAAELLADKPNILSLSEAEQLKICREFARNKIMDGIQRDLKDFDVHFDSYYSQETLGRSGKVEQTLEELKRLGKTKEEGGALWLKSTEYGDDKDRVLVKSEKSADGKLIYTYLTPDIAYHHEKFNRGFEVIIDILGPDHHGYIARLKASQAALGHNPDNINVLIAQLVTLFEDGKEVRMSTRAGQFVTLRQILDEVGRDAGRFFFVMRKFDAHLDFDLALAKSQTPENPAFYIQYAHARIESLKRGFAEKNSGHFWNEKALARLDGPHERSVMRLLAQFEEAVRGAERTLEPYRLVPYLQELAGGFHRFYSENRVMTEDVELTQARLMLADGVRQVLAIGLNLLGVSAPDKM